jgi:hypothetical protein
MIRIILPALLLTGCVAPITLPGKCYPAEAQGWIGQRYDHKLERRIGDVTHAAHVRVIRPGEATTMDFRENRANIELDDRNTVVRIYCG